VSLSLCFTGVVYVMYENHWFGLGNGGGAVAPVTDAPAHEPGALTGGDTALDGHAQGGSGHSGSKTTWPRDGATAAAQYLLGYVLEQSLSLDNMFVIAVILAYFRVPAQYQHRVLVWGIIGAVVMRGAFIVVGALLISLFGWFMYVFAAILVWSAIKMLRVETEEVQLESNLFVRLTRKVFRISPTYDGPRFFTRIDGVLALTPMMLVLIVVDFADFMFAFDSIPAIFAVTPDPFIVFTSNIFAILGLRSLYFALAGMMDRFEHLKFSLVFVLIYIAAKMVLAQAEIVHINPWLSLGVVLGALGLGVLTSVVSGGEDAHESGQELDRTEDRANTDDVSSVKAGEKP
jgi:tellurite resistance protein TerC